MKSSRLSFIAVLAWSLSACSSKKPPSSGELVMTPASASPALPSTLVQPLASGPAKPLSEVVAGKVAVVDLWATWCTACRDVSKNVELIAEAHKDKSFIAVGLAVGEERDVVSAFFGATAPKIPIYLDPQFRVSDALDARELPTILVVDRDGKIRLVKRKVDSDVVRLVDKLLAENANGAASSSAVSPSASVAPAASVPPSP